MHDQETCVIRSNRGISSTRKGGSGVIQQGDGKKESRSWKSDVRTGWPARMHGMKSRTKTLIERH